MATMITGAGLIGTAFAQFAAQRDEKIVFIDPLPREDYLAKRLPAGNYKIISQDIRNSAAMADILRDHQIDTVIHTASRIGQMATAPLSEGFSLNIDGTAALIEAIRQTGTRRLVHVSTFGVYDWRRPTPVPLTEDFPRGSGVPYSNFKVMQELLLEAYQRQYKFELAMLRVSNIYGLGHFWAGSGGGEKVQKLILAGLRGETARIPQSQTMTFEYSYSRDIGRAIDIAATISVSTPLIVNIGAGQTTNFDGLIAAIRHHLPALNYEITADQPPVSRDQHIDISRAEAVLGWKPAYNLISGIGEYIAEISPHI